MQGLTFITLGKDSESSKELAKALSSTGYGRVVAEYDNPSEFLANIARLRPSAAVITLRQDHLDNGFALIKEAIAAAPATAIITACSEASPAMIMGSIRAGARERCLAAGGYDRGCWSGGEASPAMIMGSIRAGAREFLQLLVNPDELRPGCCP